MFSMSDEAMVPEALGGAGLSGPRPNVSPAEQAKRRLAMRQLFSAGASDEDIARAMGQEYGMTPAETEHLQEVVARRMLSESEQRKPFKKAMAEARIQRHISAAAQRQAWGPVAQLESQLSRIQGTEEPVQTNVNIDAKIQSAALHLIGDMSADEFNELVAEEVRILPKSV